MIFKDRVAQATNASGLGDLTLDATLDGFKTFQGSGIPVGVTTAVFPVLVKDGLAWEIFEAYLVSGSPVSLHRGTLINSSTGSRINLSNATNKPVYLLPPAETFGPSGGRARIALTTGTAPDYVAAFPTPVLELKDGVEVTIIFHAVNPASPATFTPDGLTTKHLKFGRPVRELAPNRIPQFLIGKAVFRESDDCWVITSALPAGVTKTISGTTYGILEEDHQLRLIFTSATAVAVTVPQATGQFAAPFEFPYFVAGAGTVTFTPTTSTISSPAADSAASLAAVKGQGGTWYTDGANYRSTQAVVNAKMPPSVRQTVLSGPVDSNGAPNFGGSTGSGIVTATGSTLIASAANGFDANGPVDRVGLIASPSWTALTTNGTMYLYLDIAADGTCTAGSTTLAPNDQRGGTYATTNGQFTFNIQEMVGKVGNGSVANQTYRVFVGEVTVAGAVVTAIKWYALMGRFLAPWTASLPGTSTFVNFAHNIGSMDIDGGWEIECTTIDNSFAVGNQQKVLSTNSGGAVPTIGLTPTDRNNVQIQTAGTGAVASVPKGGGAITTLTQASWKHRAWVQRRY